METNHITCDVPRDVQGTSPLGSLAWHDVTNDADKPNECDAFEILPSMGQHPEYNRNSTSFVLQMRGKEQLSEPVESNRAALSRAMSHPKVKRFCEVRGIVSPVQSARTWLWTKERLNQALFRAA